MSDERENWEPTPEEAERTLRELAAGFGGTGKKPPTPVPASLPDAVPERESVEPGASLPGIPGEVGALNAEEFFPSIDEIIRGISLTPDIPTHELYRTLLEQIPAVTFMTSFDNQKMNVYVSPQIESILGYSPKEWLASPGLWYDRLHPEDRERWEREFAETVMSSGRSVRSTYRFRHRDGRIVWILGDVQIRRDEETGFPLFVQAVGFDISELKNKEREIQEREATLREIVSRVTETFWILPASGDAIEYASPAFEKIWGVSHESTRGRPLWETLLENAVPEERDEAVAAFSGIATRECEIEHRLLDEEEHVRWVRTRTYPVHNPEGVVVKIIAVSEDVTERRKQEEQAERKRRREVVQVRSHAKKDSLDAMVGTSRVMEDLRRRIRKIARSNTSVIISGESGTGKQHVAQALHYLSRRAKNPFIDLNCATISESMPEADLFGVDKGAATGVSERAGAFELANGGTLFLDEIGELPLTLQPKLLKVLQEEQMVKRVGNSPPRKVDVRVIVATHRDLEALVEEGKFRQDLYHRLKVSVIRVPPLREHSEDIPELAEYFLEMANRNEDKSLRFSEEAAEMLLRHPWAKNNVRELKHAIDGTVASCDGPEIMPEDLPDQLLHKVAGAPDGGASSLSFRDRITSKEREFLLEALERADWDQRKAARELNLTPRSLTYYMEKLDITPPENPGMGRKRKRGR